MKSTSNGHSEILLLKVGCVHRTKHSYIFVYIVIIDDYRYFSRVNVRRSIVTSGDLYLLSSDEAGNRKNRGQRTKARSTKRLWRQMAFTKNTRISTSRDIIGRLDETRPQIQSSCVYTLNLQSNATRPTRTDAK